MEAPDISSVNADQRQLALSILSLGFSTDPVMRWLFPNPETYLKVFPAFADAMSGAAVDQGTAYLAGGFKGCALWLAPGVQGDEEAMAELVMSHASETVLDDLEGFMQKMASFHPNDDNCWYLPMIAVDSAHQGKGLGAALMKHALLQIDQHGNSAYLESSNTMNISLYERHGFEITGSIQAGNSPEMFPMFRPAR